MSTLGEELYEIVYPEQEIILKSIETETDDVKVFEMAVRILEKSERLVFKLRNFCFVHNRLNQPR